MVAKTEKQRHEVRRSGVTILTKSQARHHLLNLVLASPSILIVFRHADADERLDGFLESRKKMSEFDKIAVLAKHCVFDIVAKRWFGSEKQVRVRFGESRGNACAGAW